jgi:rod shape-determining protein MreD
MNKKVVTYLINFIIFVLLQIFVLNKICLWECITPMVYICFIMSLPFQTPRWVVILLGFSLGLTIDFFTGVIGLHALATLVIAFIRPMLINLISSKEREEHLLPIYHDMRLLWYLEYVFLLTFIHHFVYFFVDVLSFHNFFHTSIVILSNTVCSLICIFLIQILFYKSSKRY